MPSWISSVKGHAYAGSLGVFRPRINADTLVENPDRQHRRVYDSCAGLRPYTHFKLNAQAPIGETDETWKKIALRPTRISNRNSGVGRRYSGQLVVKGLTIHEIWRMSDRALVGVIPREGFLWGGWVMDQDQQYLPCIPDKIWRTLVADCGPYGIAAPL